MKNKLLLGSLFFASCLQAGAPGAMPSVADVFGGMSEDEITRQVQLGQQFLEDLEKFGTPEEKAQFEQLLVETLNSMTPDDFDDIQKIAKMVEPNLQLPIEPQQAPVTTIPSAAKEDKSIAQVEGSEVENFKSLISSIVQRIDDILQKMNSSKECAQELDTRWSSRATFGNMKRQIYQLRNTRLAQKLAKSDISGEDKSLVDTLKEFSKELTQQNDSFTIEDDFGLPSSRETEQKQLKKTKTILTIFDGYIDSLMPKLEKFLVKWDPEALQLAKESEEKSAKALKDASDATIRRASPDARPSAPQSYGNQIPGRAGSLGGSGYQDFGGAEYPGYNAYDQYAMPGGFPGYDSGRPEAGSSSSTGSSGASAKSQPTTPKAPEAVSKPQKSDPYEDATDMIDDHLIRYNTKYEQGFNEFLAKLATDYPLTSTGQPGQPQGIPIQEPDLKAWLNNMVEPYTKKTLSDLSDKFSQEFPSALKLCQNISGSISDMDPEASKKLASYTGLTTIEQRFDQYKQNYEKAINIIDAQFKKNLDLINDNDGKRTYTMQHEAFKQQLHSDLEKRIENAREEIALLNIQARRKSNRKTRSATTTPSTAINI